MLHAEAGKPNQIKTNRLSRIWEVSQKLRDERPELPCGKMSLGSKWSIRDPLRFRAPDSCSLRCRGLQMESAGFLDANRYPSSKRMVRKL